MCSSGHRSSWTYWNRILTQPSPRRFISMDPTMDLRATQDSGTDVSSAFLDQEFA